MLKFSGDYHYSKKEYLKAAEKYEQVLDVLSEVNVTVSQDTKESLCRSYMYCGKQERSLDLAKQLVAQMSKEDEARQRQSLILYSSVCTYAELWPDCADTLEKLIPLSPYYDKFWMQLGHAYMQLSSGLTSSTGDLLCSSEEYIILALTCFIKASLLVQTNPYKVSEKTLSRNKEVLVQIKDVVNSIPLPEEQKNFALQWMRKDKASYDPEDKETKTKSQRDVDRSPVVENKSCTSSSKMYFEKYCLWFDNYCLSQSSKMPT